MGGGFRGPVMAAGPSVRNHRAHCQAGKGSTITTALFNSAKLNINMWQRRAGGRLSLALVKKKLLHPWRRDSSGGMHVGGKSGAGRENPERGKNIYVLDLNLCQHAGFTSVFLSFGLMERCAVLGLQSGALASSHRLCVFSLWTQQGGDRGGADRSTSGSFAAQSTNGTFCLYAVCLRGCKACVR